MDEAAFWGSAANLGSRIAPGGTVTDCSLVAIEIIQTQLKDEARAGKPGAIRSDYGGVFRRDSGSAHKDRPRSQKEWCVR